MPCSTHTSRSSSTAMSSRRICSWGGSRRSCSVIWAGGAGAQEAVGTLPYMAPEQIEGHPRASSDQYALAVVVYEWLCGSRPFEGSVSEMMVQHLSLPPPPLRERLPTISPE